MEIMAMKREKDALLMLAHRKERNEKRIPNGLGCTVTHSSAMGTQDGFNPFCNETVVIMTYRQTYYRSLWEHYSNTPRSKKVQKD